ncbi:hypothetical protein F2P81_021933 [Scophthalmus maximus]|uniref:Uncharacterized protein n=1 Tax=Scophthalmus maximus TaxID=52904 RepID=A0A6A4S0T5_SCOMX|nr:hypothetical protein F2P81_021933 [Scophthalmus maximus]
MKGYALAVLKVKTGAYRFRPRAGERIPVAAPYDSLSTDFCIGRRSWERMQRFFPSVPYFSDDLAKPELEALKLPNNFSSNLKRTSCAQQFR